MRFVHGSAKVGLYGGEYARVTSVSARESRVTISRQDGTEVNYDPQRLHGLSLYREVERAFAQGDRVQFTQPQFGVAPGQAVVFYDGERVLGGGWIV